MKHSSEISHIIALEEPGNLRAAWLRARELWDDGGADPEVAVYLAFYEWWSCVEPDFLTGLPWIEDGDSRLASVVNYLQDPTIFDERIAFVLGWMATEAPYCCGPYASSWTTEAQVWWAKYLRKSTLTEISFLSDSEFGRYFTHIFKRHEQERQR